MIGKRLRDAGLHRRALAAWAGTDRLSALPARLAELAARPITPASAVLALFVAGVDVPVAMLRAVAGLDQNAPDDLVERRGASFRARVAILPIGSSLVVCDRADTLPDRDTVYWPDDSSYHLASALPPGRVERWLDLGCGSAFAALARPELGTAILGTDLNPRAIHYARLGAALSGLEHLALREGNLGEAVPAAWRGASTLVSCNAPIPGAADPARWRATTSEFFTTLFEHAETVVAESGTVVVHGALAALGPVAAAARGERVVVVYTPATETHAFAVAWWRPHAEGRHVTARRALTIDRPHLDHDDRVTALAGTLSQL